MESQPVFINVYLKDVDNTVDEIFQNSHKISVVQSLKIKEQITVINLYIL